METECEKKKVAKMYLPTHSNFNHFSNLKYALWNNLKIPYILTGIPIPSKANSFILFKYMFIT